MCGRKLENYFKMDFRKVYCDGVLGLNWRLTAPGGGLGGK